MFRAIRLLLDDNLLRSAYRLDEKDFCRCLGRWQGHWIIISLEFEDISQDEAVQTLFLHNAGNISNGAISKATYNLIFRPKAAIRLSLSKLSSGDKTGLDNILKQITLDDYETIFTGKSEADFNDENLYKEIVGDFDLVKFSEELEFPIIGNRIPHNLSITKGICFTFIQALRDVVADFQNNKTNPLLTLLKSKSGNIDLMQLEPITQKVIALNGDIENLQDVQLVRKDITKTIREAAGETYSPSSLSIKSDLPTEADKLFQSLKLFVGEEEKDYEGNIHELSLGGANLIYLTLKLLEFQYRKDREPFANFLFIEEPEAHIHTHIQKTLFDRLKYSDTQIVYSTHSTFISAANNVRNINILGGHSGKYEAYQPATGLAPSEIGNIQRYLDAVRSNLLFAKSVVLVEGDAEEILIPILVKEVFGVSLDEIGISLINIGSTGFKNIAILFHDNRIRKRCGIITDLDMSIIDTTPQPNDSEQERKFKEKCERSQKSGIERKTDIKAFVQGNSWIDVSFAPNTFEVDFITAGNAKMVVGILGEVYTDNRTINEAKAELESCDIAQYGRRVLTMANYLKKGWFAILLGKNVNHQTVIPEYILTAISFACQVLNDRIWYNILSYRVECTKQEGKFPDSVIDEFKASLNDFGEGNISFIDIRGQMKKTFPDDQINCFLAKF